MLTTSTAMVTDAADRLGWDGDVVGPVEFGGARFWAVVKVHPGNGIDRPVVHVAGCLFVGPARSDLLREASLLAAYAPRAVLVDTKDDLSGLVMEAAVLDQGVVVSEGGQVRLLTAAGPRVARGPADAREQALLDSVYQAWLVQVQAAVS
jgi:hypothetical protein